MGLLKKLAIYTISNGFTNDALGNVVTKQAANLKKEGKTINYEYDYGRLTAINYPDHPENNVKYHYGGINSSHNRIGRLMLREDGSGAIEYYYGKMGEVLKTVRTLIVPNQAVATYVTQWKYDSHNRLLEMIYPDEEKVTYGYNLGGQVDHVRGYKSYGYDYVNKIGYDKFEQRTYLKYCNGAETFYSYDPARRRLQNLVVNAKAGTIMDNAYSYDAVSNVLGIKNNAPLPQSGKAGGQMSHSYTYDPLYRLASATGTYKGTDNKAASYTLSMGYDNMHRITSKKQHLSQTGVQFEGTLNAGYDLTYTYQKADGKKFQLDNVRDINYRTEETPTESTNINNGHKYTYDANGNLVYINTSRVKKDGKEDEKATEQKYRWDEENRLLAADENGFVSNYWYDADGERTVKTSGENEAIYVNSEFSGGNTGTARFSLYVSPYLVAGQGGKYTKHSYVGSQRIVSKLGDLASYGADPRRIPYAGKEADGLTIDYKDKYAKQLQSIKDNYKAFDQPYNGEDNDDYVNGQGFCCNDGTPEAAQAMARTRAVNGNFKLNDDYEKMQFYYHPDHLGSSSYITNLDGEVSQHIEYVPFGEVFIEERNNTWNTPYLFNAKEFDEETGMYYYGARYYDPRLSLWMNVDRFAEKYPSMSSYQYCASNPINLIDIKGDSIIVDNLGYVVGRQGKDNIVYRQQMKHGKVKYIAIGELGKIIHANVIYSNLLKKNAKRSRDDLSPFQLRDIVKTGADWDFKNNKNTIYGLGNDGKTKFEFQGKLMEAQDIGNHHFGVVVEADRWIPDTYALKKAGEYQIKSGTSKPEWQKYVEYTVAIPTTGISISHRVMLPPYGDDPRDQKWIRAGFNYYKNVLKGKF